MRRVSYITDYLSMFEPFFTKAAFENIKVLFSGAVLSYGARTITGGIKAVGFETNTNYHPVWGTCP